MSVGETLRELGAFLDECEEEGAVTDVELVTDGEGGDGGPLSAEVQVELAGSDGALSLQGATVDAEGGLRVAFESATPLLPAADHEVDVEVTGATFGTDGAVRATLSASVPVDEDDVDPDPTGPDTGPTEGDRDGSDPFYGRDVPPFRDPDLLAEVYASCDTFAEMTDEIGMDVTAETVRRYMIDHGIHEPNSYDTADPTGTDASAAAPGERDDGGGVEETAVDSEQVVLADGIGLPDDVTVETLIETVKRSNTIYEVKQNVGIERQDALEMLRELNLLDLVVGRLATEAERDISREEIVDRLREASTTA
jgi:hypothetical protein